MKLRAEYFAIGFHRDFVGIADWSSWFAATRSWRRASTMADPHPEGAAALHFPVPSSGCLSHGQPG